MGGPAVTFNAIAGVPWGLCAYNRHDTALGKCIGQYGEFSEDELDLLRQVTPVGSIVLDIGANIGAIAVPMAMHVGDAGAVVAFEPQRLMFQLLCGNAAINSVRNLYPVRAAVGAKIGQVMVAPLDPNIPNSPGSLRMDLEVDVPREAVGLMTVDSLDSATLKRVSLIKIDVEGMECEVIHGALQTIKKYRPFLYVENDRKERSAELIELIRGLDYTLYWDLPILVRPAEGRTGPLTTTCSINMICFPVEHLHRIDLELVLGPDDTAEAALERHKEKKRG